MKNLNKQLKKSEVTLNDALLVKLPTLTKLPTQFRLTTSAKFKDPLVSMVLEDYELETRRLQYGYSF